MNVYDFDKTIYDGDSTVDFIGFCVRRYPAVLLKLPITLWSFFLYMIGVYTKTRCKERMYSFLKYVPKGAVECFWDEHKDRIKPWYYDQQREDDVVISASPEFLVEPICRRMGIMTVIASRVNSSTGKTAGENCSGEEKVRRLREWDEDAHINEFYSDSYSDQPLADMADQAYMVRGNERIKWGEYEPSAVQKAVKMFLSREFLMFLFIGVINTGSNVVFSMIYSSFITDPAIAFIPGYVTANVVSYLLNSKFTFREELGLVRFIKFFISYLPNFFIQMIIVWLCTDVMLWPKLAAYVIAAVIGVPVTFVFMKIFAFGKRKK